MSKEDAIRLNGVVRKVYPNSIFKVELCDDDNKPNGHEISATISGKIRLNRVKILEGDEVEVEISPYDLTNGRIVWRRN